MNNGQSGMSGLKESIVSPLLKKPPELQIKIRIGVLASGYGSNFEALIKSIKNHTLNAEIALLIVNKEKCGAIIKAEKNNIPFKIISHHNYNNREEYDSELIKQFDLYNIDCIVMAGWMRIVTSKLIQSYPGRIINIHPSLLPSFKGNNAINQAIEKGVKVTGCTVHIVEEDVDSGPIIIQSAIPIEPEDTYDSLRSKIQSMEHVILPVGIGLAANEW